MTSKISSCGIQLQRLYSLPLELIPSSSTISPPVRRPELDSLLATALAPYPDFSGLIFCVGIYLR